MAAQPKTALARAIKAMRQGRGWSHDTLVDHLRSDYGLEKASRPLVIAWEKKARPSNPYRAALVDLGVPDELWSADVATENQTLRDEVAALRQQVARLQELQQATLKELRNDQDSDAGSQGK